MMVDFQTERDKLAAERGLDKSRLGSCIIINDILLYGNNPHMLLDYFDCVCSVFDRHWLSFKLLQCKFFFNRLKFIGIDIGRDGNMPAQSKFAMINGTAIPRTQQFLLSFISLCGFYA